MPWNTTAQVAGAIARKALGLFQHKTFLPHADFGVIFRRLQGHEPDVLSLRFGVGLQNVYVFQGGRLRRSNHT
jgi:hypothetical protein